MLNEVYDTIEAILEGLDTGGEQSRAFAEEIKMLKEILGYPEPAADALEKSMKRCQIARKIERVAIQAEEMTVDLPTSSVATWLDDSFKSAAVETSLATCDLARLLQFIADFGVRRES